MAKIRITTLLRPYWHWLAVAFVALLAEGAMDVLEPWPLKIVFDNVIGSKKMPAILANLVSNTTGDNKPAILEFAVIGVIAIAVTGAIASYIQKYLTTKVGQQVMHDLRHILYHHIQRLSLSYYEQQKTGDLIVRITSDIDAVQDFVSSALLGIVIDILTLVGMLCVMSYLDRDFTLIALSVAPILFFVVYSYTHRIKKATRAVKKKESEIASTHLQLLLNKSLSSFLRRAESPVSQAKCETGR